MVIGLYVDRHKVAVTASSAPARQVVAPPASTEARDISESLKQEFRREEFVRLAFYRATGREADRERIQQYVNALRNKARTKAEVFADICAIDESKATRAGATEAVDPLLVVFDELAQGAEDEFIERAYCQLLMRAPDAGEMTQLLDRLKSINQLSEADWAIIANHFHRPTNRRGRCLSQTKNYFEAMLWASTHDAGWRDLPEEFGNWNSIHRYLLRGRHG
jgi:hypothetical protein